MHSCPLWAEWQGEKIFIKLPFLILANIKKLPQVGQITADGASVNSTTICEFENETDNANDGWTTQEHDIQYCVYTCLLLSGPDH
jgi:hypothetical protein